MILTKVYKIKFYISNVIIVMLINGKINKIIRKSEQLYFNYA